MNGLSRLFLSIIFVQLIAVPLLCQKNLEYYIGQAKQNSPLIQKANAGIANIKLDLEQIRAIYRKPEIALNAGVMLAPILSHDNNSNSFQLVSNGANSYQGYDMAVTDGGQYQALISVTQPLLNGKQFSATRRQNEIQKESAENALEITEHELEQAVTLQYILCLQSKQQASNSMSSLNLIRDKLRIMENLVENAVFKTSDLILLQIEYTNKELDYRNKLMEAKNNLYDLNLLCGITDTVNYDLTVPEIEISPDNSTSSVFLYKYHLDSLTIIAKQNLTGLEYKPQLSFYTDAGLNATYLPTADRLGFSAGLSFSWKIFDGNQLKISKEKTTLSLQSLDFERNNFLISLQIQKNKILEQLGVIDQNIVVMEDQLKKYDKLLELYGIELNQGSLSVIDFKNVLNEISQKKQELLNQKMQKQLLIQSFNYLNY